MEGIKPISMPQSLELTPVTTLKPAGENTESFSKLLGDALDKVNELQKSAEQMGVDLAAGKNIDIHNVMIAAEKASLAVALTVQVRNKVIEAYQEVMRMQL